MAKAYKEFHIDKKGKKSLCSGYGVYPSGEKCSGCMDCKGKFVKKAATNKQLIAQVNKTHSLVKVSAKKKK